ncbi:L(+)-mandelate dehydrogenase domain protein [Burkholderia thailandensis]|uniref:L(+)-mandelate dehydrogenase domain protein n=1 Tax=Burkholderia thailandensis TaxID=57975 RepID=A0AAW9CX85_BURTH|nr:L(+)-mandelate dehydrogenase domain protein [Burkholderia thailandensis]MDW9253723.1 L(+)-mandelate dehydrogenase domain protein [Burkholderia thailandensis]
MSVGVAMILRFYRTISFEDYRFFSIRRLPRMPASRQERARQ